MSTNANKETHGCELFDAYLTAKKAFTTRIKNVLEILAKFNALDVTPSDWYGVYNHGGRRTGNQSS